jgi:hypothetical protein
MPRAVPVTPKFQEHHTDLLFAPGACLMQPRARVDIRGHPSEGEIGGRGKRGGVPAELAPILERLHMTGKGWLRLVREFRRLFRRSAGTPRSLRRDANKGGAVAFPEAPTAGPHPPAPNSRGPPSLGRNVPRPCDPRLNGPSATGAVPAANCRVLTRYGGWPRSWPSHRPGRDPRIPATEQIGRWRVVSARVCSERERPPSTRWT